MAGVVRMRYKSDWLSYVQNLGRILLISGHECRHGRSRKTFFSRKKNSDGNDPWTNGAAWTTGKDSWNNGAGLGLMG